MLGWLLLLFAIVLLLAGGAFIWTATFVERKGEIIGNHEQLAPAWAQPNMTASAVRNACRTDSSCDAVMIVTHPAQLVRDGAAETLDAAGKLCEADNSCDRAAWWAAFRRRDNVLPFKIAPMDDNPRAAISFAKRGVGFEQ